MMATSRDLSSRNLDTVPVEILVHICNFLTLCEVQDLGSALGMDALLQEQLRNSPKRAYYEMALAVRMRTSLRTYRPLLYSEYNEQMILKKDTTTLCVLKSNAYFNRGRREFYGVLSTYPVHVPASRHVRLSEEASHAVHFERLSTVRKQAVYILENKQKMIVGNTLINMRTGNIARFLNITIPAVDGETFLFDYVRRTTIVRTMYDRIKIYRFKTSSQLELDGEVRIPRRCGFIETVLESEATGLILAISTVYPKRLNPHRIFIHQLNEATREATTISLHALLVRWQTCEVEPLSTDVAWEALLFERGTDMYLRIQSIDNSSHRARVDIYNLTQNEATHHWRSPAIFPFAANLRSVSTLYRLCFAYLSFVLS